MTYGELGKGTYSLRIGSLAEQKVSGSTNKFSIVGGGDHTAFGQQGRVKISVRFSSSGEKAEVSTHKLESLTVCVIFSGWLQIQIADNESVFEVRFTFT